jgi:hypothetical protein
MDMAIFAAAKPLDYQPTFSEPGQFNMFLKLAVPGQRFVYATCSNIPRDNEAIGSPVPGMAWRAYAQGRVCLVQRRLGPFRFEYIAICRRREAVSYRAMPASHFGCSPVALAA